MSIEALAAKARLNRSYLSGVERGVENPSLAVLVALAGALRVPPAVLFEVLQGDDRGGLQQRLDASSAILDVEPLRLMVHFAEALAKANSPSFVAGRGTR